MKTKLIFLIIILSGFILEMKGQNECGTSPDEAYLREWADPNSYKNQRLDFIEANWNGLDVLLWEALEFINEGFEAITGSGGNEPASYKKVPIVGHVVRRTNGTGGLSDEDLKLSIVDLNYAYGSFRIIFELCEIKYIDSDALYNFSYNVLNQTQADNQLDVTTKNVARKLNVYFVPNANGSYSNFPGSAAIDQHMVMKNRMAKDGSTFAHELGHWFDLEHTHAHGSETKELVSRTSGKNCDSAADDFCDTPADPYLLNKVSTRCVYTRGERDPNGVAYNPDVRNIMSYALPKCKTRFSAKQVKRFLAAFLNMETERGYKFENCANPVPLESAQPIVVDWSGDVPLIPKTRENNAWSASVAMVLSWRDQYGYTVQEIESNSGRIDIYEADENGSKLDMMRAYGLMVELPSSYSAAAFADLLTAGPMIFGTVRANESEEDFFRGGVVVKMQGDGTPEGTMLTIHDSGPINQGEIFELTYKRFVEVVESQWEEGMPGAVHLIHP